jgi:hypothetical protein
MNSLRLLDLPKSGGLRQTDGSASGGGRLDAPTAGTGRGCLRGWLIGMAGLLAVQATGWAAEPPATTREVTARRLLAAVTERGWSDVAGWLLDRIEADPDFTAAFREAVPLARGRLLVESVRREPDLDKRQTVLDEAQRTLDQCISQHRQTSRAIEAMIQLAGLLIERGRLDLLRAERGNGDAERFRASASDAFLRAAVTLEGEPDAGGREAASAVHAVQAEREAIELQIRKLSTRPAAGDGRQPRFRDRRGLTRQEQRDLDDLEERRQSLRASLLQIRLLAAEAHYERSRAAAGGSEAGKAALEASSQRYREIATEYRSRAAGLWAEYFLGRNQAAGGDPTGAVRTLADLRRLDGDDGVVPILRAKAINVTLGCWLTTPSPADDAQFDRRLRDIALAALPDPPVDPDWLEMKYRAAVLLRNRSESSSAGEKKDRAALLRDARQLAGEVVAANGFLAREARQLVSELGAIVPRSGRSLPAFDTAMDEARSAFASFQTQRAAPDAPPTDVDRTRDVAMVALRQALAVGDLPEEGEARSERLAAINQARYLLAYLCYDGGAAVGRLHDAAVLGGFLAERYPQTPVSRQAAKIALASWQQLQSQADGDWATDARRQAVRLAEHIMDAWPLDAEAGDAALVAVAAAAADHDPDGIEAVLRRVSDGMPRRAEVLLRSGVALWQEATAVRDGQADRAAGVDRRNGDRQRAIRVLDEGLEVVRRLSPQPSLEALTVMAAIVRCQAGMEDGDIDGVIRLLDDPVVGPWKILRQEGSGGRDPLPATVLEGGLSLCLMAFIETERFNDAETAMRAMEARASQDAMASARLNAMYLRLGRDLERRLAVLGHDAHSRHPQSVARAEAMLVGYEQFLEGLVRRDDRASSRIWVATTFLALGTGETAHAVVPPVRRQNYLARAKEIYESLLSGSGTLGAAEKAGVRLKLAEVQAALKDWTASLAQMQIALTDGEVQRAIAVQTQAAELLEAAGEQSRGEDARRFFRGAIEGWPGSAQGGESVIWGWGRLAQRLSRTAFDDTNPQAQDARTHYFEARYRLARCRLKLAECETDPNGRKKLLDQAERDVIFEFRLHSELGGEALRERFDQLLTDVQTFRGDSRPAGLSGGGTSVQPADGPRAE